jgi:hypothetical protein
MNSDDYFSRYDDEYGVSEESEDTSSEEPQPAGTIPSEDTDDVSQYLNRVSKSPRSLKNIRTVVLSKDIGQVFKDLHKRAGSYKAIAEKAGVSYRSLEDFLYQYDSPTLAFLDRIFGVLGKSIEIHVVDAADFRSLPARLRILRKTRTGNNASNSKPKRS